MTFSGDSYSLKPIERRTIADQISGQLLELIREGRFTPGERMPSERQLCEDFGVARTTLREAIQQLVSLGVLERQTNRLYVVDHIGVVDVPDEKTKKLQDLVETRRCIEISVTELAVCRATDQQRKELLELAESFHSEMDPEEFRNLNHRFHMKIGECCSNPLLEELYGRVLKAVFDSSAFSSLLYGGLEPEEVKKIVEQVSKKHKEIAKAIFEGDAIAASAAAADHVAETADQIFEKLV